jgi:hypothetical protein
MLMPQAVRYDIIYSTIVVMMAPGRLVLKKVWKPLEMPNMFSLSSETSRVATRVMTKKHDTSQS